MAGKTAKCPHCGERVRIPVPKPKKEEVYEAEEMDGAEDFDFGGFDPNAGATVPRDERKPCRACGEMIMRKAAKCRYCGEIFDPALKRRKKSSRKRSRSRYGDEDEDLDTLEWLLVIFCGGIACIVGLVYVIQGKPKGSKMIGFSILSGIIWRAIGFVIGAILEGAG